MPEYTVLTLLLMAVAVGVELSLRVGLFRRVQYWISIVIVLAFQIPVDGFLTRLDAPTVVYSHSHMLGVRGPWDIPIEDFGFGWALATTTLSLWQWRIARVGRTARDDLLQDSAR